MLAERSLEEGSRFGAQAVVDCGDEDMRCVMDGPIAMCLWEACEDECDADEGRCVGTQVERCFEGGDGCWAFEVVEKSHPVVQAFRGEGFQLSDENGLSADCGRYRRS